MSLGLGIFLSAVLISTVLLYRFTYERWNWKRVMLRALLGVGGLVTLGACIVGAVLLYEKYEQRPVQQEVYSEIRLGMSMAEVQYIKGQPTYVLADPPSTEEANVSGLRVVRYPKDFSNGEKIEDYFAWSYHPDEEETTRIEFDPETKAVDQVFCFSTGYLDCPSLFGVYDGVEEESLIEKLGPPDVENIDGMTKSMEYHKLNAVFRLRQKKVVTVGLWKPPVK